MLKVTRCTGEGQGSCKRCTDNGKWNRTWMCFLNKIEGYDGCYCNECTKKILKDKQIEEMTLDIDATMQTHCFHKSCNECEFDHYNTCKAMLLATTLINDYGYHKEATGE